MTRQIFSLPLCSLLLPAATIGCLAPSAKTTCPAHERLDPGVATSQAADGKLLWYDAWQLRIEGKGWESTERPYDRLPAKAKDVVREGVWGLSRQSAGLAVRFVTDSPQLKLHWVLTRKELDMFHMPATGMSSIDIYVRRDNGCRWLAIGKALKPENLAEIGLLPGGTHEYMLFLPLYNGVASLRLGVPSEKMIAKPAPRSGKPIVFYGTSITQGGCASRPGMAYPAIIGRQLDRETINLGFSGNGRMDPELADLLAEIDASVYVLACMENMAPDLIAERVVPFVQSLRKARPKTPIMIVENITYPAQVFIPNRESGFRAKNDMLRRQYDTLTAAGVTGIHYVSGERLYGDDGEGTVDGCHATDLGFLRFSEVLVPRLRSVLGQAGSE